MKKYMFLLLFSCFLLYCSNDFKQNADKSKLLGDDYRLFKDTPAWNLAQAVKDENIKEINKIISSDTAIINYQEPTYGKTLLFLTVMNQQFKPFMALLERGADVNIHDSFDGSTVLMEACQYKFYKIDYAQELIEYGADVNAIQTGKRREKDGTMITPLMSAVGSGNIDFVNLLLKHGANVNYYNEFGQSAFSESVMLHEYKISYLLLNNGADYKRPIFYRPDYSIPLEKCNPHERGEPLFLVDVLRENFCEFGTEEYQYKMKIVDFLKTKGIDYKRTPVPDFIRESIQGKYPNNWQDILEKY